jgi:hypothetical protein
MLIPGDQWPVFLYAGYQYDPEDPWKGLFRSSLLISVSCVGTTHSHCLADSPVLSRLTSTFSHLRAQSTRLLKQHGLVMHESMV